MLTSQEDTREYVGLSDYLGFRNSGSFRASDEANRGNVGGLVSGKRTGARGDTLSDQQHMVVLDVRAKIRVR